MSNSETTDGCFSGYTKLLAMAATTGRRLTRSELNALRAFGEQAAGTGATLRQVVAVHLEAARSAWPGAPASTDSVLAVMTQAIDALAEGYDQAQHFAVRQQEAARREFIDDLLYGRSNLGRLAERAERFGLRLSHAHASPSPRAPIPMPRVTKCPGGWNAG